MLLIEVKKEKGIGKILEIDEIVVDKDKRRQGIGKAVIDSNFRSNLKHESKTLV